MAPKKGVSAEEKRLRMLAVFHESGDVYCIKEVEKFAVKAGVIAQAVKDVLQSLLDDDLARARARGRPPPGRGAA